jgi:Protein of unknown function (DUF2798)
MSLLVSGMSTFLAAGLNSELPVLRLAAWLSSWAIAFPSVLVVAPFVPRILHRIVIPDRPQDK